MKHAYLILAHTEFEVLKLLVSCLDDPRNDIYVHFDKKVAVLPELQTRLAGLTVLDRRIDVRWGAPSMVEAELVLFEAALAQGPYQYYHLLSGVDLPLKSQDYIHDYFDRHAGEEFIGYTWTEMPDNFKRKVPGTIQKPELVHPGPSCRFPPASGGTWDLPQQRNRFQERLAVGQPYRGYGPLPHCAQRLDPQDVQPHLLLR